VFQNHAIQYKCKHELCQHFIPKVCSCGNGATCPVQQVWWAVLSKVGQTLWMFFVAYLFTYSPCLFICKDACAVISAKVIIRNEMGFSFTYCHYYWQLVSCIQRCFLDMTYVCKVLIFLPWAAHKLCNVRKIKSFTKFNPIDIFKSNICRLKLAAIILLNQL